MFWPTTWNGSARTIRRPSKHSAEVSRTWRPAAPDQLMNSSMNLRGSMDFRVDLSDRAQGDIAAIYDWLSTQYAGEAGERWFAALRAAIESLARLPSRCPVAPESRDSPVEVRQ